MLILFKCIAGGLSAGLVLLWWPRLVEGASVTAWLGRGVAFTLSFELLLLGLRPLEQALWATQGGGRFRGRLDRLAARLRQGGPERRLGPATIVATAAVAVPVLLIAAGLEGSPARHSGERARPVQVVRVTKVVRRVNVRRVVVPSEAAAGAPASAARTAAPLAKREPGSGGRTRPAKPRTVKTPARAPAEQQRGDAPASQPTAPGPQSCTGACAPDGASGRAGAGGPAPSRTGVG